jgi:hypothetical protein
MKTIKTWLPCFSGFYGTIWQSDMAEEQELDHINDLREEKRLEPIKWGEMQFDYSQYNLSIVKGIAAYLEREFKQFVSGIEVEKVVSPRFYNFTNDSADVTISLSDDNIKAIEDYLAANRDAFSKYLKDKYTSRSGFISSYPNSIGKFMWDNPIEHQHKLGAILEFIFENEDSEVELNSYYNVESYIEVTNYSELVPE